MKDARNALVKALKAALDTACDATVYARMPKSTSINYPYIHISDIYNDEVGPKDSFQFNYDTLIQVVYKDQSSLVDFYDEIDKVVSTVNNNVPFALDSPFRIMESTLLSTSTTEYEEADGSVLNVAAIRINFFIEEGN